MGEPFSGRERKQLRDAFLEGRLLVCELVRLSEENRLSEEKLACPVRLKDLEDWDDPFAEAY